MKNKSIKILYTYIQKRSFVDTDLRYLSQFYDLSPYEFPQQKKSLIPLLFLRQGLFLIVKGWRFDYFITFFAGYHSVLPSLFAKLTGKKSIIILGGTDCFKYPSFRYGNFTKAVYGWATCLSARFASLLAPVSGTLMRTTSTYYTEDSSTQGIYHWCKGLDTPYHVVPTEYNPEFFKRKDIYRKPNSFLTIGFDIQGTSFVRKGIDMVISVAKLFPEYEFTIIGCGKENFPVEAPTNVTLRPPVPYASVPDHMSAHQFYLQLSVAEGLPNAVCEAMLCECIPIGSNVAGIPDAIGSCGFIVRERTNKAISEAIKQAIAYGDKESLGKKAREHIITNFGPGSRINALRQILR